MFFNTFFPFCAEDEAEHVDPGASQRHQADQVQGRCAGRLQRLDTQLPHDHEDREDCGP